MARDKSLPSQPVVGDLVKLKSERIKDYESSCEMAGYKDFDAYATHEVIRVDAFGSGGSDRLFVAKQPFCFLPRDVKLQLTDEQRREMLLGRNWVHDKTRGTWRAPR